MEGSKMQRVLSIIGRGLQAAVAVALIGVIACSVYLIVIERVGGVENPTVFGYSTAVVMSGSMEPTLGVGDLIINRTQDNYAVGDVITFDTGTNLTTHRITEVTKEGFITQGDANNAADSDVVSLEAVVGKVVASVPQAGDAVLFLKSPIGLSILLFVGFLILWLPSFLGASDEKRANEEES